jgi:ketosteroid isomerase-like protein
MVTALSTRVTRSHDIFDPVVVTVGSFHAGTAENIIPASAQFDATVRSFSAKARAKVRQGITEVVTGVAHAHGLEVEIDYHHGYPVTVNDAVEAEFVAATVVDLYGADRYKWMANPEPGSEDFSYVLAEVPGAFVFLGACPADLDPATAPTNHAPQARFDDAILADGATLLAELAVRRLTRAAAPTVARAFNDCINARDLAGLTALMTDDHTFVDSEGSTTTGRDACVEAWRGFFASFPDYCNVFDTVTSEGDSVYIAGRSECSEPELAGPALWRAVVHDGRVAHWQIYVDSPHARSELGLVGDRRG